MRTILTYGTFDLFHIGHLRILQRLRALGDRLVVGCSTDCFNELKGKKTVVRFEDRLEILQSCRYVDFAFPESSWGQKRSDIVKYCVDVFGMGDDWTGKFNDLADLCVVIYLPRTPAISTTELKIMIKQTR